MVEPRNYEFACHITTQIDEGNGARRVANVQELIQKHGGVIAAEQLPQRTRLSYPVKHQRQAFFGWVQFGTESETLLAELDEWARLQAPVLRHIVLKLEPESDKRAANRQNILSAKPPKQAKEGAAVKKVAPETKAGDEGKLEKDLEDVLGNL